jgi:hypothetical protein
MKKLVVNMFVKLKPDLNRCVGAQGAPHVVALRLGQEIQSSLFQGFGQALTACVLAPFGTPAPTVVRSRLAHFLMKFWQIFRQVNSEQTTTSD